MRKLHFRLQIIFNAPFSTYFTVYVYEIGKFEFCYSPLMLCYICV